MFESNEAVRGRLIGPKPWDRIDKNFGTPNGAAVTAMTDLDEAGNDREMRVHNVNR